MAKDASAAYGAVLVAGIAVAVLGGYALWQRGADTAPSTETAVVDAPGDAAPVTAAPEADPASDPVEAASTDAPDMPTTPEPPSFDIVRVDPVGDALVAGRAPPGQRVNLRLDGEIVASAESDGQGNFVSLFDVPQGDAPRILTLETEDGAGAVARAADSIIVAPVSPTAPAAPEPPQLAGRAGGDAQTAEAVNTASLVDPIDPSAAEAVGPVTADAGTFQPTPPDDATPAIAVAELVPTLEGAAPVAPRLQAQPDEGSETRADPRPEPLEASAEITPQDAEPERTSPPQPVQAEAAPDPVLEGPDAPTAPPAARIPPSPPTQVARAEAPTADDPPTAPRLFRAGPDGIRALPDTAPVPQVETGLGLDAISYDAEGEVQLAGRGARDTDLRIYLDNRPIQTSRVDEAGNWASPLPNVDTGVYMLRVDALDAEGRVASRIETPFQRTDAAEAILAGDAAGVTAITVQPGFTLWAISEGYFGEGAQFVQIFDANRELIANPDLIYPGQVFTLPETQ